MRYPLVDGQGNFGSVDGDSAGRDALHRGAPDRDRRRAARRHRQGDRRLRGQLRRHPEAADRPAGEAAQPADQRLRRASPSGMATNIPPHHLGEVVRRDDRPDRRPRDRPPTTCASYVLGPGLPDRRHDLPLRARSATRSPASGRRSTRSARCTPTAAAGSSCAPRSRSRRSRGDRMAIIVTELPYQVNKATLLEKIAELVKDKQIDGHQRPARRVRPRRHAHVHRDQARRRTRTRC